MWGFDFHFARTIAPQGGLLSKFAWREVRAVTSSLPAPLVGFLQQFCVLSGGAWSWALGWVVEMSELRSVCGRRRCHKLTSTVCHGSGLGKSYSLFAFDLGTCGMAGYLTPRIVVFPSLGVGRGLRVARNSVA